MTKTTNKLLSITLSAIAAFTLWQCSKPENEFSDFVEIAPHGWVYGDTLALDMPDYAPDSMVAGDLAIVLSHNNGYPYSNLWLEVTTPTSNDSTVRVDTVNIVLADDLGNWRGSGSGIVRTLSDTVAHNVIVRRDRHVLVRHIMRVDTLRGVERIGIKMLNNKN